jgi:hypothetical protein
MQDEIDLVAQPEGVLCCRIVYAIVGRNACDVNCGDALLGQDAIKWSLELAGVAHKGAVGIDLLIGSLLNNNIRIFSVQGWWEVGVAVLLTVICPHGLRRGEAFVWHLLANGTGGAAHDRFKHFLTGVGNGRGRGKCHSHRAQHGT